LSEILYPIKGLLVLGQEYNVFEYSIENIPKYDILYPLWRICPIRLFYDLRLEN